MHLIRIYIINIIIIIIIIIIIPKAVTQRHANSFIARAARLL